MPIIRKCHKIMVHGASVKGNYPFLPSVIARNIFNSRNDIRTGDANKDA